MTRLEGHDELTTRLAAIDPAAGIPELTDGALERVTRHAMAPVGKAWTWRRFRLASLGALAASSAFVVAGILGIQAAAPELPVLAIGAAQTAPGAAATSTHSPKLDMMMRIFVNYVFSTSPSLTTTGTTPSAYELVSTVDPSAAAAQLAQVFGVTGPVTSPSDGYYQVGPDNGPNVSTWTSDGVVGWSYSGPQTDPASISSNPTDTTTTVADATLPSDTTASSDAIALLVRAGVDPSMLGTAQVDSSSGTEVDVTVPLVVDGFATDQSFYVSYGHDDALLVASGNLATATAKSTYPTISPSDAVNVLTQDNGFVYYGGFEPMVGIVAPDTSTTPSGASTDPGSTGTTVPPGTDGTSPTTEPEIDVSIDHATMQLGTYTLTDGTTWLLATWGLSGPESGQTVTDPATYSANVLAVDPSYVQLQSHPINY